MSVSEIGYVPGLLRGRVKARIAWRGEDGVWRVALESGRTEGVSPERVFPTARAAEAKGAEWWPETAGHECAAPDCDGPGVCRQRLVPKR